MSFDVATGWWCWLTMVSDAKHKYRLISVIFWHDQRVVYQHVEEDCGAMCRHRQQHTICNCAGKPAREQHGFFTNSEYIGEYPCRYSTGTCRAQIPNSCMLDACCLRLRCPWAC